MAQSPLPDLSELEGRVMKILWSIGEGTADAVRRSLESERDLTDSSVRTLLRRLEAKGYVTHDRDGRRFVFRPLVERQRAAASAARRIIDTLCGGDADQLLLGMVTSEVISSEEIESLQRRLAELEDEEGDLP